MAKLTYLELVNRVLRRISEPVISDVTALSGKAQIVADLINEAQDFLFSDTDWYSLYKTRAFSTIAYTSAGVITFVEGGASADTITDASSGFVTAGLVAGMEVVLSGSDDNNKIVTLGTVAAGTLTLQTSDDLTDETATAGEVTITSMSYNVASDFGRTIDLMDTTSNTFLLEDYIRTFDEVDPNHDFRGIPSHFTLQASTYRLHPIPSGTFVLRERYWKTPDTLATNTATSNLPIETQNLLILYALEQINEYLNKFDQADRFRITFTAQFKIAKKTNKQKIDRLLRFQPDRTRVGIAPAKLPSTFDGRFR